MPTKQGHFARECRTKEENTIGDGWNTESREEEETVYRVSITGKKENLKQIVTLMENCIKREYSNARTPQQNGVAERKNRTLIEAARTMLADSFLPNTFWAEAVRKGPNWLFDLDYLTDSMNYLSVSSENQANIHAGQQETNQNEGSKDKIVAGDSDKEDESAQDCFEVPYWHSYSSTNTSSSKSDEKRRSPREEEQVFWMILQTSKGNEKRERTNEEAEKPHKES
ncbi:putative ribonuclease H-like domain-containing protein [Tanacetum coccineum]